MNTVEKIIDLLARNGISGAKMSRDLGFSNAVFSQWKNGKQKPSADKLALIASYFNVAVDYFYENEDKKISPPPSSELEKVLRNLSKSNLDKVLEYAELLEQKEKKQD